jgi:S1-C subfamily serine protease
MAGRIFISYRRDDARADARSIHDRLARKFGDANVFMDVDSLMAGQRFDRQLDEALANCDVLLAVMGSRWTEALTERMKENERDFVHDEIAAALKRDIAVIPVLVGQEARMPQMPRAAELPENIRDLAMYQKHSITHESFSRNIDDLIEAVEAVRRAKGKPRRIMPLIVVGGVVAIALVAALIVFRGEIGALFTRATPEQPQAKKEAEAKTADLSPAEIADRFGKSVVSIQFQWQLYERASGRAIYHKASIATLDGKQVRLPAYLIDGGRAVPWLTTDDEAKRNFPVRASGAGTGFVATADGLILTTRTIGSAWSDGISSSSYLQGDRAALFDKEGGALKARVVAIDSLAQTRFSPDDGPAKLFPERPPGDELPGGIEAELFGRNDELLVRFANSDIDIRAELVRRSRDQNAALLKIETPGLAPLVLADGEVKAGLRIVSLSLPDASKKAPSLAEGLVRSVPVDGKNLLASNIQTSLTLGFGTTGSPVFAPDGRVVGIVNFFTRDGGQLTTYALPIKWGRNLLEPQATR